MPIPARSLPHPAMSTPPPSTSPSPQSPRSWYWPSRRALLYAAGAFVIGLLLFVVIWYFDRDTSAYKVEPAASADAAVEFEPLPVPLPANGRDKDAERLAPGPQAELVERAPPPAPPTVTPPAAPVPPAPVQAVATSAPTPIQMPPPDYPRRAWRRGEEGTVLVKVDVGTNGIPTSVGIARSSRSRALDRAALDAVRRWRFRPAMANGQPTTGSVVVPVEFSRR